MESITSERHSAAMLIRLARERADANRHARLAIADALGGGRGAAITDLQRARLSQMLRTLIDEVCSQISEALEQRGVADGEQGGIADLLRAGTDPGLFDKLSAIGMMRDPDLIEAVVFRLCQCQLHEGMARSASSIWDDGTRLHASEFAAHLGVGETSALNHLLEDYLYDRSRWRDEFDNPVLLSGDLDSRLLAVLFWNCAAVLRSLVRDSAPDGVLEAAVRKALYDVPPGISSAAAKVVSALEHENLLTPAVVLTCLELGEIPLFERCFARLSGIRPALLRRLVYEPGAEFLAVLSKRLGLSGEAFSKIFHLTRPASHRLLTGGEDGPGAARSVFENLNRDVAEQLCAFWSRTPEYLNALRHVELGGSVKDSEA
jgi:hypothetical protein